jgi:hypothetical protein
MSNWNSVKEITNWEGGTVELWNDEELEWRTSSKRKLRAIALLAVICYFVIVFLSEQFQHCNCSKITVALFNDHPFRDFSFRFYLHFAFYVSNKYN